MENATESATRKGNLRGKDYGKVLKIFLKSVELRKRVWYTQGGNLPDSQVYRPTGIYKE